MKTSFLLCEAFFCFIIAVTNIFFNSTEDKKGKMYLSLFASVSGILLVMSFCTGFYSGKTGAASWFMMRLSEFLVYFINDLITFMFTMYLNRKLFGSYGFRGGIPCVKRAAASYIISAAGMILVIVSQFTHMYYRFDENNVYHREWGFIFSIIIGVISVILDLSILAQYRKNISQSRSTVYFAVLLAPFIGTVIDVLKYGFSAISICIGFSFVILYMEQVAGLNGAVIRASKTEARTGIANEHACIDFIDKLNPDDKENYACVFFDIKKFGSINQKYGHDCGDLAIAEYVKKISSIIDFDEILGRQASDKFIAFVRKNSLQALLDLLVLTEITIRDSNTGQIHEISISAVCGVYELTDYNCSGEESITKAAAALSYAKNVTGREVEFLTREMKEKIEDSSALEVLIPGAMENDEFIVYYQPKVNSSKNALCGAEALVRWMHEGEIISPGRFIPLMEKNDEVCKLDFYMLRHVCKDLENWIKQGLVPPTVSVNFSRRNLSNPNLAAEINEVVKSYHVPKKMIEIEITETVDEFPISVLKEFIDSLHRFGYTVAVDDFGCGSSSLSLLREVTFDTLKIDKGFVDRSYAKDLTILSYIIKLAKAINLEVLAEGVEHAEQVKTLSSLGCDIIQGYFFDKPLPRDIFEKRIKRHTYEGVE